MEFLKKICIFFIVVGIIFGGFGLVFIFPNGFDSENKVFTKGIINNIETYFDIGREAGHDVFVTYNVDGKKMLSKLNTYKADFYVGKEIDIYYYKNNPTKIKYKVEGVFNLTFSVLGLSWIIIGGTGLGFCNVKERKRKFLIEKGEVVYATYIETLCNENYSVNGEHPYYIVCEWEDLMDNKRYLFKSKNIWINPERMIQERQITTFPVYINTSNMKEYLVDISIITDGLDDVKYFIRG